ncbi:hypothetical protein FHG87_009431, partial [Trinorchestia longiramus]
LVPNCAAFAPKVSPPIILEDYNPFIYPGSPESIADSSDDEYYCLGDEYTPSPSPPLVSPPSTPAYIINSTRNVSCKRLPVVNPFITFDETFPRKPTVGPISRIDECSPDLSKNRIALSLPSLSRLSSSTT